MEKKLYLLLLLVIFIIFPGCGGSENSVIPSPAQQEVNSEGFSFIRIKIVWPQEGVEGRCICSSGSEDNNITTSIAPDIIRISLAIFSTPYVESDPNMIDLEVFDKTPGSLTEERMIPIPIDYVNEVVHIVTQGFAAGGNFVTKDETDLKIMFGGNDVTLDLNVYELKLTPSPDEVDRGDIVIVYAEFYKKDDHEPIKNANITLSMPLLGGGIYTTFATTDADGKCNVEIPTQNASTGIVKITGESMIPVDTVNNHYKLCRGECEIHIIGRHSLEQTPDKPIIPVGSSSVITVLAKKLDPNTGIFEPLEGIQVYMGIDSSSTGEVALIPDYVDIGAAKAASSEEFMTASSMIPLLWPTDEFGQAWGTIYGKKPGTITVTAQFQDPDDPNTIISGSCNVEVTEGNITYNLKVGTPPNGMTIPPDFKSNCVTPDNETIVQATLFVYDEYGYDVPIPDEEIRFSVVRGIGEFEGGIAITKITDYEDNCYATLTTDPTIAGPREIEVQVEYVPDPNKPWITPPASATCIVQVSDGLVLNVNFDSYSVGTSLYNVAVNERMGFQWGSANHWDPIETTQNVIDKEIITGGYSGNGVQLYTGTYGGLYGASGTGVSGCVMTCGYNFPNYNPQECRFYVKVGTEQLNKIQGCSIGGTWYRGICGLGNWDYDLLFRTVPSASNPDIYDGTTMDCIQQQNIGEFSNGWVEVRIQYLPQVNKICYWYGDNYYEYASSSSGGGVYLSSFGGTVWYDEIRQYDLKNFKAK